MIYLQKAVPFREAYYLKNSYNRSGLSAIESMDRYLHEMTGMLRKMKLEVRKNAPGKN
ncbi:MAG: hypothetical protein J0I84_21045 [Terrimonas sp.]|nr:hypothetical protein [Terrimonas sp.]